MTTHVIEQGRHRERPSWRALLDRLPWFSWSGRPSWRRTVVFLPSCRYTLPKADQADVNKLGGLSFGGGPHQNSARVGWAYNSATDKVDLSAYFYVDGTRAIQPLHTVLIGERVQVVVEVGDTSIYVQAAPCARPGVGWRGRYRDRCATWFQRHIGLRLGLFFGGSEPAPHRMEIQVG